MPLSIEVILWCVVVPAIVACIAALLGRRWISRSNDVDETADRCCSGAGGATIGLGWWIGLAVAMASRQWMNADVDWLLRLRGGEGWQTSLWPMLLFAMVPSWVGNQAMATARFVGAAVIASLLAYVVMPGGEGWEDMMQLHRSWSALIVASVMLNTFALDGLIRSGAKVWTLLVMIAGVGPGFLLVSLNYGAPAEWTLAGLASIGGVLLASGWATTREGRDSESPETKGHTTVAVAAAITLPVSGLIATAVTTARFYTWENYPSWLYAVALFLPSIVAFVDYPLRRSGGRIRIPVAGAISSILLAACIWKLILQEPPESW